MTDEVDGQDLKDRLICSDCVGEEFLSNDIESLGQVGTCHYCSGVGRTFTLEQMAARISTAFSQHYQRTDPNPTGFEWAMMRDKESTYDWERHGELVADVIQDTAEIDETPANDIQQILRDENAGDPTDGSGEEEEFDDESHYEQKKLDDETWQREWNRFEHSLKTESRYFSEEARAHLARLFDGVATMRTQSGADVIVEAGPEEQLLIHAFYRARTFESWSKLEPALIDPAHNLGPPPAAFALGGRMNARGIAVFYGADEPETALAEVRPPVGANVVVARFKLVRRVRLLDLKAFADILERGSIFDLTYAPRKERALFLERLLRRMTMPVMPSDEALEYLPTQAVADFLASRVEPELDGILFPSVQVPGEKLNVVLFQKAARIATIEYPTGTKLSVDTGMFNGEEWEHELIVIEEVPPPEPKKPLPTPFDAVDFGNFSSIDWDLSPDADVRPITLEVDLASLEVRKVTGVQFHTADEKVDRKRIERQKRPEPSGF
jgi:RES domain/HEPN/RES N-terminal domain 1